MAPRACVPQDPRSRLSAHPEPPRFTAEQTEAPGGGGAVPGAGVVRIPAISQPSFLPRCLLSTSWGPGTPQWVATVGSGPPLRGVLWGQHRP